MVGFAGEFRVGRTTTLRVASAMKLFSPDPPSRPPGPFPACTCFNQERSKPRQRTPVLHGEQQNTSSDAWLRLCDRIDLAIDSHEEDLAPLEGLNGLERAEVITLPASIGRLIHVRKLRLYGSHLVRIPPEIGGMRSLVYLDVYTSYRLHFFPYEITRCANLRDSRVSTRALFGNYKHRPPFPELTHNDNMPALSLLAPSTCSVCGAPVDHAPGVPRWITLRVGTDRVPLLANACSSTCIDALPTPAAGYVQYPHVGGARLVQPPAEY